MNGFIALHSLKEENAKGKNKTTAKIKREAIKHLIRVEKCSPPAYILRGIWVSKKNNADGKKPKRKFYVDMAYTDKKRPKKRKL